MTANLPDHSKRKFYPSEFQIMLIYCGKGGESDSEFELVQSTFDSHFKLTLTVDKKVLPAGDYIILIAPQWCQSTYLDPQYFNIRVGIYSPQVVNLRKCEKERGFKAIAACFTEISADTPIADWTVLQDLPEVYKGHCYRHIC